MESIKESLALVMRNLETKKAGSPKSPPQEWLKKILTKKEMGHIRFEYFQKGIMGLSVDSSSWLYALNLRKEELLSGLKKENRAVRGLSLRIGELR